jgi:hypothetical protein
MTPRDLQAEQFSGYLPAARRVAVEDLDVLRQLPLSLLPSLLREIIDYDFRFPAERKEIDRNLAALKALTVAERTEWLRGFESITVSKQIEQFDWINQPAQFLEQLSAYLWSTHQMDAFRKAATEYSARLDANVRSEPLPMPRLGIAVIGQGVDSYSEPLFRNLRVHGTWFDRVKPDDGLQILRAEIARRAESHPEPYAHWYVDGGAETVSNLGLSYVSFGAMVAMRDALLKDMQTQIARPGMGPEELRTHLERMTPSDLGFAASGDDVLDRFRLRVLTEGSGTQIFSTTFVQWTVREALRRAQPLTVLARFAPRQRQRPMNELLAPSNGVTQTDPVGSLVDADMGACYHWINQQRLPGSEASAFLVWFEGHNQALAISPTMTKGKQSSAEIDMKGLLASILA